MSTIKVLLAAALTAATLMAGATPAQAVDDVTKARCQRVEDQWHEYRNSYTRGEVEAILGAPTSVRYYDYYPNPDPTPRDVAEAKYGPWCDVHYAPYPVGGIAAQARVEGVDWTKPPPYRSVQKSVGGWYGDFSKRGGCCASIERYGDYYNPDGVKIDVTSAKVRARYVFSIPAIARHVEGSVFKEGGSATRVTMKRLSPRRFEVVVYVSNYRTLWLNAVFVLYRVPR